jgi:hypothetical protein
VIALVLLLCRRKVVVELVPGAFSTDQMMRLNAITGFELGQGLVYPAAGKANVKTDGRGDDWDGFTVWAGP